jgi:BirA family biotin operon repressor/biotin-[acetyl-CoA-carboxylase] ligase
MLDADLIRKELTAQRIGRDLRVLGQVPSTNGVLAEMARAGAPEGTAVLADEQTAGRGRLGQTWFSPPGLNVYGSVLLRPALQPREVPGFSFITSLALTDAIETEGLLAAIKWPNDVLVGRRKVGGALVETATSGKRVEHVVLGFGVNLNVRTAALRAALGDAGRAAGSLAEAAGREVDRNRFAAAVLNALERRLEIWETRGPAAVLAAWRDRDILTGRRVAVRTSHEGWSGRVLGVDREGYLLLRDTSGARRRILTGEVRLAD